MDKHTTFPLGRIVATQNLLQHISFQDIEAALKRYRGRDWGDLCEADRLANDFAVDHDERMLASYTAENGTRFWVITEWDRSATTVLLPDDY